MQTNTIINIMITGFCLMIYTHISLLAYPFMTENLLIDIINKKLSLMENYLKTELGLDINNIIVKHLKQEKNKISKSDHNRKKYSFTKLVDSTIEDIQEEDQIRLKQNVNNIYKAIYPWAMSSMLLFIVPLLYILSYEPESLTKMHMSIIIIALLTLLSEAYLYRFVFKKYNYKPNSLQEMVDICTTSANTKQHVR
jgi:hypothetical protein